MNKKTTYKTILISFTLLAASVVFAAQAPTSNAGPDMSVNQGQTITLQGSAYDSNNLSMTFSWSCNGGSLSNYSVLQPIYTPPSGSSQGNYTCTLTVVNASGLSAADSTNINVYSGSQQTNGNSSLSISKKVINLTSQNLNWQPSINANPGDVLSFAITLQANNQAVHNVYVQDVLPSNLIFKGNMLINASITAGNPASGINIGTIPAGEIRIITYQAQVAPASSFSYGTSTISNNATVTSNETGSQTASSQVLVTNTLIYGATDISTGLTNKFLTESFFLPLLLIVFMSWLYFTGRIYMFADWLGEKIN